MSKLTTGQNTCTMYVGSKAHTTSLMDVQKNMERDIEKYLLAQEVAEIGQNQTPKRKVPVVSKSRLQNAIDWAYDEMVDNRITLKI